MLNRLYILQKGAGNYEADRLVIQAETKERTAILQAVPTLHGEIPRVDAQGQTPLEASAL